MTIEDKTMAELERLEEVAKERLGQWPSSSLSHYHAKGVLVACRSMRSVLDGSASEDEAIPAEPISEADRRLNVESNILAILSSHGGETIVAGPPMERLVAELRVEFDALVLDGRFLPTIAEMR